MTRLLTQAGRRLLLVTTLKTRCCWVLTYCWKRYSRVPVLHWPRLLLLIGDVDCWLLLLVQYDCCWPDGERLLVLLGSGVIVELRWPLLETLLVVFLTIYEHCWRRTVKSHLIDYDLVFVDGCYYGTFIVVVVKNLLLMVMTLTLQLLIRWHYWYLLVFERYLTWLNGDGGE